jgi:hypothetical protein
MRDIVNGDRGSASGGRGSAVGMRDSVRATTHAVQSYSLRTCFQYFVGVGVLWACGGTGVCVPGGVVYVHVS